MGGAAVVAALPRSATAAGAPPTAGGPAPESAGLATGWVPPAAPVTVDISAAYDNDGVASAGAPSGDFDGSGYTYPAEELPTGTVTVADVPYLLPVDWTTGDNNVVAQGQRLALPAGEYLTANLLVSASYGPASGTATVHYEDGTTSTASLSAPNWYDGSGPVRASFRWTPDGSKDLHAVSIGVAELVLDATRRAVGLTLPPGTAPREGTAALHVWALSLQPAAVGKALRLRDVRTTRMMLSDGGPQAVEATLVNLGTGWVETSDAVRVTVDAPGVRTVAPVLVGRLGPGEQLRLRIGIDPRPGVIPGTVVSGAGVAHARGGTAAATGSSLTLGVPDYVPTEESIGSHQAPYWFSDAKFGIFIHWGVYSVPGWAPVGKQYAEWYWEQMNDPTNPTYAHHRDTYGEDFAYDDFIPMFTAKRWDPRSWVELIRDAGAEYYVLTSKHHEGFALWDSKVSDRNSVKMGPKRVIVKELFAASRRYTPQLRNGLYFTVPEWFNPDSPWFGHAPRNPYTLEPVPYTGYRAGRDYVRDYQAPQLLELVDGYDPDVIWFDIGGDNDNLHVLTDYLNGAKNRRHPKDVTFNDRGGISAHDFTTPEYTTYPTTVVAKWEASRGLDPNSYGINRETPPEAYMTTEEVVHTLVDVTSKNGNFLLDIGPNFDGTIPAVMQQRLRQTGEWLAVNGEAIRGTTFWSRMAEAGSLRFTVKQGEAFYIHSLEAPGATLVVPAPVPIRPGDRVTMLGYGRPLEWNVSGGALHIAVPPAARRAGRHAWVFKVDTTR